MGADKIILSCKVSAVQDLIAVYSDLARQCDYALHLGLTEAGMGSKGIVASTAGMSILLPNIQFAECGWRGFWFRSRRQRCSPSC